MNSHASALASARQKIAATRGGLPMVGRGELTDKAWENIAPLLPENGRRGKQWKDHRTLINGTFFL